MGHPLQNTPITLEEAAQVLSAWKGDRVGCSGLRPLSGGMINSVYELEFIDPPHRAVLKVSAETGNSRFSGEYRGLRFLWDLASQHGAPPLFPEPYLEDSEGVLIGKSVLLMERLSGINLGQPALTPGQKRNLDAQLARFLGGFLHTNRRNDYGDVFRNEVHETWANYLEPRFKDLRKHVQEKLDEGTLQRVDRILEALPELMKEVGPPTLVHGDLWACNVIVDVDSSGEVRLTGLVDSGGLYADVEYELAYLECFQTVTPHFFEIYEEYVPRRPGYETRRLLYWLQTMLIHVWLFGDEHYRARTKRIAEALDAL
jgi:fructosamine-3-kinase